MSELSLAEVSGIGGYSLQRTLESLSSSIREDMRVVYVESPLLTCGEWREQEEVTGALQRCSCAVYFSLSAGLELTKRDDPLMVNALPPGVSHFTPRDISSSQSLTRMHEQ